MTEEELLNQLTTEVDLSKVETSFPLLKSGIVKCNVAKCNLQRDTEKKGDDAKPYYLIEYNLAQPWTTVPHNGAEVKTINPGDRGSKIVERVYIGKYTDKDTNEEKWYGIDRIAKLYETVFGRKAGAGTTIPQAAIEVIGQEVLLDLLFEPKPMNRETKEVYGPRTSVRGYVKKSTS